MSNMDAYYDEVGSYVEMHYELLSSLNKKFSSVYEEFTAKTIQNKNKNHYNWKSDSNIPSKKSIVKLVFVANEQYSEPNNIDFTRELNCLLQAAGYSPLHSRNPEDSLIKYCLKNNITYSEFGVYLSRLELLVDCIAKTQYSEELFNYIRSGRTKVANLSEKEISEFEAFIKQSDNKVFSKTRLAVIRYFSELIEKKRDQGEATYTTHWIQENIESKNSFESFEQFNAYLNENVEHWT